jgi:hypothetical protein
MKRSLLGLALALVAGASALRAQPLGTSFTYQGRLADAGVPANGTYDLELRLFAAPAGGTALGTVLRDDVVVTDGLFTVRVDFGPAFTGSQRWLEVGVRPGASSGPFTTIGLRQELAPAPHATFGATAPWAGITGKPAGFADDVDNDSGGYGAVWTGTGTTGLTVTNGSAAGFAYGIQGASNATLGRGLFGLASSPVGGNQGVFGQSDSTAGTGVYGVAGAFAGITTGVLGTVASPNGRGVFGRATATTGGTSGVSGQSDSDTGRGVYGLATAATGVTAGVRGEAASSVGSGVSGIATYPGAAVPGDPLPVGVRGRADNGYGMVATSANFVGLAADGLAIGVQASNRADFGAGVFASATNETPGSDAAAVVGNAEGDNWAGVFFGKVDVAGTLSKTAGSFVIDHPLDPANKYLVHSFVESPDMKNVYDGVATLDARGEAVVELPDWFEALNRDFRYQLTAIGAPAPGLHVAARVAGNRFRIGGGPPGLEVSWQVTGIRQDAYARAHPLPVEVDKPEGKRGTYRHPVEHGAAPDQGEDRALRALARRRPNAPQP